MVDNFMDVDCPLYSFFFCCSEGIVFDSERDPAVIGYITLWSYFQENGWWINLLSLIYECLFYFASAKVRCYRV